MRSNAVGAGFGCVTTTRLVRPPLSGLTVASYIRGSRGAVPEGFLALWHLLRGCQRGAWLWCTCLLYTSPSPRD
eukprot:5159982-Alexandrium_andersonii.AAC.1